MIKTNIKVLLVEDNKEEREQIKEAMKGHPTLQLVAETGRESEACEILKEFPVDAIILDLELQEGSGMFLLEKMRTMDIEKPFVTVVTNVVSSTIYTTIRALGADYIAPKKNADYSPELALSVIELSVPYSDTWQEKSGNPEAMSIKRKMSLFRKSINHELEKFGFTHKNSGTEYIAEGLLFMVMNPEEEISITKTLYPYLAEKFQTNSDNIERNIRIALEKVWQHQDLERLKALYPYSWSAESGRPTNMEFLKNISKRLM